MAKTMTRPLTLILLLVTAISIPVAANAQSTGFFCIDVDIHHEDRFKQLLQTDGVEAAYKWAEAEAMERALRWRAMAEAETSNPGELGGELDIVAIHISPSGTGVMWWLSPSLTATRLQKTKRGWQNCSAQVTTLSATTLQESSLSLPEKTGYILTMRHSSKKTTPSNSPFMGRTKT